MRFRVYLKPFTDIGTYQDDWIDITDYTDLKGIGNVTTTIDNDEYSVGVYKTSSLSLTLSNESGLFSEVGGPRSLFNYKRSNSLVKVTWATEDYPALCGFSICGEALTYGGETDIFTGLLSDESMATDIRSQKAKFKVLGRETLFETTESPYASINNGDTYEEIIYTILNQTEITDLLTISASNINTGVDVAIDDKTDLNNKTVKDVLDDILEKSGSILYIDNNTVYVEARTVTPVSSITLYGQSSLDGVEDIMAIKDIRNGVNKTFNYWKSGTLTSKNSSTIATYGVRKHDDIEFEIITDSGKRQTILDNLKVTHSVPKESLKITTPMTREKLALTVLDGVSVDYPTVLKAQGDDALSLYNFAIYDEDLYPLESWAQTYSTDQTFKILGRSLNTKDHTITFNLTEV